MLLGSFIPNQTSFLKLPSSRNTWRMSSTYCFCSTLLLDVVWLSHFFFYFYFLSYQVPPIPFSTIHGQLLCCAGPVNFACGFVYMKWVFSGPNWEPSSQVSLSNTLNTLTGRVNRMNWYGMSGWRAGEICTDHVDTVAVLWIETASHRNINQAPYKSITFKHLFDFK